MPRKEILDRIQKYTHPFRVTKGEGFHLKRYDPGDTLGLELDKGEAAELLRQGVEWLAEEQDMLYAQDRWSLLLVFQAMDAAGQDSTIKHVMSGVNPQGCQVSSFKQPSQEDLDHDFLWRYSRRLPDRGKIGIFNRCRPCSALVSSRVTTSAADMACQAAPSLTAWAVAVAVALMLALHGGAWLPSEGWVRDPDTTTSAAVYVPCCACASEMSRLRGPLIAPSASMSTPVWPSGK